MCVWGGGGFITFLNFVLASVGKKKKKKTHLAPTEAKAARASFFGAVVVFLVFRYCKTLNICGIKFSRFSDNTYWRI